MRWGKYGQAKTSRRQVSRPEVKRGVERSLGKVWRIEAKGLVDALDMGNERNRAGEKDSQMLARYKDSLDSNSWLQILTGLSSLVRLQ